MKTRAAVLRKGGTPWEITELDLDEPEWSGTATKIKTLDNERGRVPAPVTR